MLQSVEIKIGQILKDRSGLAVRVDRIDASQRIRFSVVADRDTNAGPGEMSYNSFMTRFAPSEVSKPHLGRKKAA